MPIVGKRTGATWTSYIAKPFYGVNRNAAADRLAGAFYNETSATAKKTEAVQALLMKVRRQGSMADMIVMNDED